MSNATQVAKISPGIIGLLGLSPVIGRGFGPDDATSGTRVALLAFGAIVPAAEHVGEELGLTIVNMRFVKPLDRALILELANSHEGIVTLEDNVVAGGAGSGVAELLAAEGIAMPILHLGLPDAFQHHASREDLLSEAGLDVAGIRAAILRRWPNLREAAKPPLSAAS